VDLWLRYLSGRLSVECEAQHRTGRPSRRVKDAEPDTGAGQLDEAELPDDSSSPLLGPALGSAATSWRSRLTQRLTVNGSVSPMKRYPRDSCLSIAKSLSSDLPRG
jgi:hypothetical protein